MVNMSVPFGIADEDVIVLKYNGSDTIELTPGDYGEANNTFNITDGRIYVNVTPGDPGYVGTGLSYGGAALVIAAPGLELFAILGMFAAAVLVFLRKR